jgi:hypothetical protein
VRHVGTALLDAFDELVVRLGKNVDLHVGGERQQFLGAFEIIGHVVVDGEDVTGGGESREPGQQVVVHIDGLEDLEDDFTRLERQRQGADKEGAGHVDEGEFVADEPLDAELGEGVHDDAARCPIAVGVSHRRRRAVAEQQLVAEHRQGFVEDRLTTYVDLGHDDLSDSSLGASYQPQSEEPDGTCSQNTASQVGRTDVVRRTQIARSGTRNPDSFLHT